MTDNSRALQWEVEEDGFNFFFTGGERLPTSSDLLDPDLGPATAILSQWEDDDLATRMPRGLLVPHGHVAETSPADATTLGLPGLYPFGLEISLQGRLSDRDLKYQYRFVDGDRRYFVNATRIGCWLQIHEGQSYRLDAQAFELVEEIERSNQSSDHHSRDSLIRFSRLKHLAKQTGATLDEYLERESVIAPDVLTVRLSHDDAGSLRVDPVLCSRNGDVDGAKEIPGLEDLAETIKRFRSTKDVYSTRSGARVVFDERQKTGIDELKRLQDMGAEKKDEFLTNPSKFLDPEVFNLDDFSERVKAVGEYKPRVFPFLRPNKEPWLPPEGGILIDGTSLTLDESEADELVADLEEAIKDGRASIEWKGQEVPANGESVNAIKAVAREKARRADGEAALDKAGESATKILIIKDNFEVDDFEKEVRERPGTIGVPSCLLPGIELLEHQVAGLVWLQELWIAGLRGAILADDMGLGKTLQALTFLGWCRDLMDRGTFPQKPMLIVAPVALLENWKEEYRKFLEPVLGPLVEAHGTGLRLYKDPERARSLGIRKETQLVGRDSGAYLLEHEELQRAGGILTTYETLRDYQFSFGRLDLCAMVLDEAQKIKTPSAMVTLAAKAMNYDFGICMTGTPVENSWVDLWSIADHAQPGRLGSMKEFVVEFQNPLDKPDTDRWELGRALQSKLDRLLLRRLKEDHLEGLPKKTVKVYEDQMPDEQLHRYLQIVDAARESSSSASRGSHILKTIAALRDVSLCPLLPFQNDDAIGSLDVTQLVDTSARVRRTIAILDDLQKREQKAIVFLISKRMQRILKRIIQQRYGYQAHIINGEVAGGKRKKLVDDYQAREGFGVIIMSTEAAGVGLNVTAANHVIHLSRPWNPAKEDQATDRVYRIGQTRPVTVHLPLAVHTSFDDERVRGSFDQKLHRLLEDKRGLSRSVLLPSTAQDSEFESILDEILEIDQSDEEPKSGTDFREVDGLDPIAFEYLVARTYERQGFRVETTPRSKDFGADVLVFGSDRNYVIQCKHTSDPSNKQRAVGVQEVIAAQSYYSSQRALAFVAIVATNATAFTEQAEQLATASGVQLVARAELEERLRGAGIDSDDLAAASLEAAEPEEAL